MVDQLSVFSDTILTRYISKHLMFGTIGSVNRYITGRSAQKAIKITSVVSLDGFKGDIKIKPTLSSSHLFDVLTQFRVNGIAHGHRSLAITIKHPTLLKRQKIA